MIIPQPEAIIGQDCRRTFNRRRQKYWTSSDAYHEQRNHEDSVVVYSPLHDDGK